MNTFLLIWGAISGILFIGSIMYALVSSSFEDCMHIIIASFCSILLWLVAVKFVGMSDLKVDTSTESGITVSEETIPQVDETKNPTDTIEIPLKNYVQKMKTTTFDGITDTTLIFIRK